MTSEERENLLALCKRIQGEHDPESFSQLIEELNGLLDVDIRSGSDPDSGGNTEQR